MTSESAGLASLDKFEAPWTGRPARLGIAVLSNLVDQVVGGRLPPGTLFPSESELCAHFGVSRTVVRESMRSLAERGLAEIRQGQGTTVAPRDSWNLLDPVVLEAAIRNDESLAILDDLVTVRVTLESQMAADAARRITDEQLAEIGAMLDVLAAEQDDPERHAADDVRFHDLVMRASGNALARNIVSSIHTYARASSRYNGPMDGLDLGTTHRGHMAIYDALVAHDPESAAEAMRGHIIGRWDARRAERPAAARPSRAGRANPHGSRARR